MKRDDRRRQFWDRQAATYDRSMTFWDRRFFGDTRPWICSQASGETLEVAVGTGLNLPYYPADARLTGVEWSTEMLGRARVRAADLGRVAAWEVGDAQALRFADGAFDTVVCTFSLCAISDDERAIREMVRVLRPGGLLLLADHVESSAWYGRLAQRALDAVTVPTAGEHWRRRPIRHVETLGLRIERHDRFAAGVVERLAARK